MNNKDILRDTRKARGNRAEQLSADHLIAEGYEIVERNWRCRTGEIDIIAKQGEQLIIVEVRSRRSGATTFGTPAESITPRKIQQIRNTAAVYLHMKNQSESNIRFDVIGVILKPNGDPEAINHIKSAF